MNDGTTALPVSPVSEEDTMKLASLFSRASQAIVDASTMPKQIGDLTRELDQLRHAVETAQTHSTELDNQLREMRSQRNEAENNLAEARKEVDRLKHEVEWATTLIDDRDRKVTTIQTDLDKTRTDRDNYGLRAMQLEDDLGKAQGTLKDFQDKLHAFFPPPAPVVEAKPEPVPEPAPYQPVEQTQAEPSPEPDHTHQAYNPDKQLEAQYPGGNPDNYHRYGG